MISGPGISANVKVENIRSNASDYVTQRASDVDGGRGVEGAGTVDNVTTASMGNISPVLQLSFAFCCPFSGFSSHAKL